MSFRDLSMGGSTDHLAGTKQQELSPEKGWALVWQLGLWRGHAASLMTPSRVGSYLPVTPNRK